MRIIRGPALAVSALAVAALAGCGAGAASTAGVQSRPSASASVQLIPAPKTPSMAEVAAQLHATRVADHCGGGEAFGVVDSGTAWLGRTRIGINIFPTAALRDSWRTEIADGTGVTVIAQGADWVAYKYLSQTGTGCG